MSYILYARKSSDREDKQVQSIESQVTRLKELALQYGITIKYVLTESKSAKQPNCRPEFDKMLKLIEKRQADGILCWQINRLSRNPIDSGKIQWYLQQGLLQSIQTIEKEYRPEDNTLLLSVETGMSSQYIIELSRNVKRGIRTKVENGWIPGTPPIGYLNDKQSKTIIKDPERFNIVRKMWDMMLTGAYTPTKVLEIATNEWGLRTRKTRSQGGKPISNSNAYKMFSDIQYTGVILHKGQIYNGKHDAMITNDEFDKVQMILGRKGKPRPKTHAFAYTGIIRCAECGCQITGEEKFKKLKSGETRRHVYYHCTRKKKDIQCSQKKYIPEKELEKQIIGLLSNITILPGFKDWAIEILQREHAAEVLTREDIQRSYQKAMNEVQRKLDNLLDMRLSADIDNETYTTKKDALQEERQKLEHNLRTAFQRADNWLQTAEKVFEFACHAREMFLNGDIRVRKEILIALGSNFLLKDGKLMITRHSWLAPIENSYKAIEAEYLGLEPAERLAIVEENTADESFFSHWLAHKDSNLKRLHQKQMCYHYTMGQQNNYINRVLVSKGIEPRTSVTKARWVYGVQSEGLSPLHHGPIKKYFFEIT